MKAGPNVTHRPDGRWEARYIKGRSPEGKAIYGFCYGKTQEEAVQKADDAKRLLKNSVIEAPKRFRDIYAMWSNTDSTLDIEKYADKYLLPSIGDTAITQLTDRDLSKLLQSIKTKSSPSDTKKCFELIRNVLNYAVNEDYLLASPLGTETLKYQSGRKAAVSRGLTTITEQEYLTIEQAKRLEALLLEGLDSKKPGIYIGLYLCFHLGLTRQEVGALQFKDIDFDKHSLRINKVTSKAMKHSADMYAFEITPIEERIIPLPRFVFDFLQSVRGHYTLPNSFLVYNKNGAQCQTGDYVRELDKLNMVHQIAPKLDIKMLRETFIVRCIKNGIDMPTVMKLLGIDSVSDFWTRYGELYMTHPYDLCKLDTYASNADAQRTAKRMNLLIFGAGGEGHVAKEIAENMGIFNEIAFLDDDPNNPDAMNVFSSYDQYIDRFPVAIVALGANHLRAKLTDEIERAGFIMPKLIDPSATVSRGAVIHAPCIIESKSIINTGCNIGRGALIASGSILDRDSELKEFVHIDAGVTVAKATTIENYMGVSNNPNYINEK